MCETDSGVIPVSQVAKNAEYLDLQYQKDCSNLWGCVVGVMIIQCYFLSSASCMKQASVCIKNSFGIFCGILQLFIFLSFITIVTGRCGQYINKWGKSSVLTKRVIWAEKMLRRVRWCSVAFSIYSLAMIAGIDHTEFYSMCLRLCVLSNIAIIYLCSVQELMRITFRRWPNHVIAIGNTFLYMTVIELLSDSGNLLGVIPFTISSTIKLIGDMDIPILQIIGALGLSVVLVEAYKKSISGISAEDPANVSQGRKRTRHRLLTHWHYRQHKIIFSGGNDNIFLLFGMLIYIAIFFLAVVKVCVDAVYLVLIATVFYISGMLAHWSIDNDRLIQSEYSYLLFNGVRLTSEDIRESTVRWRDYRQVLVELYTNVNGIDSEDNYYHSLSHLLRNIWSGIKDDACAAEKFISDILQAKGDTNQKLMRDARYQQENVRIPPKNSDLKKAQDVLFSCDICDLLACYQPPIPNSKSLSNPKKLSEYDPLELLILATNWFFEGQDDTWTMRLNGCNIGAEESIQLLKIDTLTYILQMESYKECTLMWLHCEHKRKMACSFECEHCNNQATCTMPESCRRKNQEQIIKDKYLRECIEEKNASNQQIVDSEHYDVQVPCFCDRCMAARIELLINYPLFVRKSYENRWGPNYSADLYSADAKDYYWKIFDERIVADSEIQCRLAIDRIIKRLTENNEDPSYLDCFYRDSEEVFNSCLANSYEDGVLLDEDLNRIMKFTEALNDFHSSEMWNGIVGRFHMLPDIARGRKLAAEIKDTEEKLKLYSTPVYALFYSQEGGC